MDFDTFDPIFVVGAGRSGTTLMSALLSGHSRIAITPETHYMKRADHRGPLDGGPADFDRFWAEFIAWSRFRDLEVDPDRCRDLIDEHGETSFRAIFGCVLEAFRQKEGKARVGEKSPSHRSYVHTLLKWFPRARFVVIQRDPRAVVASQLKCPWVNVQPRTLRKGVFLESRTSHIIHYANGWEQAYRVEMPTYISDPRVTFIRYENLVSDVEGSMRRICAFLDEAFEPEMLERRADSRIARQPVATSQSGPGWDEWTAQHHSRAVQPVSTKSIDKWRNELTVAEVAMIEGICERGMREAGYELTTTDWQRNSGRWRGKAEAAAQTLEKQARRTVRNLRRAAGGRR